MAHDRDAGHGGAHSRSAILRVAPPPHPIPLEAHMSHPLPCPARPLLLVAALLLAGDGSLVASAHAASPAPAVPAPAAPLLPTVVVAVPALNLRAAPRLSAPILRRLPRGTVLRLRFYHVSWAAVTAPDDTIGYVDRYAVRPLAPAPAPVVPSAPATSAPVTPTRLPARPVSLTVAAAAANLRATPTLTAPILALLPRQTPLTVLGLDRTGTWARVATRVGRVGWIALYLTRPA